MKKLIPVCSLGAAVLLVALVLAVHFWPVATPPPDAVVAACLEALKEGDVDDALSWWVVRLPGPRRANEAWWVAKRKAEQRAQIEELAALVPEAEVDIAPATYWTHCCEPVQLSDGRDAFAARVEVTLRRTEGLYRVTFYLGDAAHDGMAWAWGLPWTRWWHRPRGRQRWRITSVHGP